MDGIFNIWSTAHGFKLFQRLIIVAFLQKNEWLRGALFQRTISISANGCPEAGWLTFPIFQDLYFHILCRIWIDKTKVNHSHFYPFPDRCVVALMDDKFHTGILLLKFFHQAEKLVGRNARQRPHVHFTCFQALDSVRLVLQRNILIKQPFNIRVQLFPLNCELRPCSRTPCYIYKYICLKLL